MNMNLNRVSEIDSVQFGVMSTQEIIKNSTVEVRESVKVEYTPSSDSKDAGKKYDYHNAYDPRMGVIDNSKKCDTCGKGEFECPGHFGHILLNQEIIHPLFYKVVVQLLGCFCCGCNKMLVSREHLQLSNVHLIPRKKRFIAIIDRVKNVSCCRECGMHVPKFELVKNENIINMVYEGENKEKKSLEMSVSEIKAILESISDDDVRLLGMIPEITHPRNFIMGAFPVIPPCSRPYVYANNNICDDDLTLQTQEIIKINKKLADETLTETKHTACMQNLKFRIATFFDNSKGKAKLTNNDRPLKGIKERVTGKEGHIRSNQLGKRCEQSARTVIGADPTLRTGEVAVPREIACILTIPEVVNRLNIDKLTKLVRQGKVNWLIRNETNVRLRMGALIKTPQTALIHGDIIKRGGATIKYVYQPFELRSTDEVYRNNEKLKVYTSKDKPFELQIGDVVERQLQDDDVVLFNRQPTLHKASMIAHTVKIKPCKTFRMNLASTKPFNADFDGDEMNIHIPQSLQAKAELINLASNKAQLLSSQSGRPNMVLVQDNLLGAYKMSRGFVRVTKAEYFQLTMCLLDNVDVFGRMNVVYKAYNKNRKKLYSGRGLLSLLLPDDFDLTVNTSGMEKEPTLIIKDGVIHKGVLTKKVLGSSSTSIIKLLVKEYGQDVTLDFIDNMQFLTNEWLLLKGFSVGLEDCLIPRGKDTSEIETVVQKCFLEAENVKEITKHEGIKEMRVTAALNKAKDVGLRLSKASLKSNNNFISTVTSGSKGDYFNIAQITGLLGQQNLCGKRVDRVMNGGKRSLSHYPFGDLNIEQEYESRGFISSSFIQGLNPKEFFFHAMSGREGICDTSMGTATSGYIQRRIIKLTEDMVVQYDNSVTNTMGKVFQMNYGEDNFEPSYMVDVGETKQFCNVRRIVNRLNKVA